MQTMHRTYEDYKPILFIGHKSQVTRLDGKKAVTWLSKLKPGDQLLATTAHSGDEMLCEIAARGVSIFTIPWHKAGVEKGLEADEIASAFSELPDDILTQFFPRPDFVGLRQAVKVRSAVIEARKALKNKFRALAMSGGFTEVVLSESYTDVADIQEEMKDNERDVTKEIVAMAEGTDGKPCKVVKSRDANGDPLKYCGEVHPGIEECEIFNHVFGFKSMGVMAGEFVALAGDMRRFPMVSSLWHYTGNHVIEGKAPKRKSGHAMTWNPKLRTLLWKVIDNGLKNNSPIIRDMYEGYKTVELLNHAMKCPKCKTVEGHCGARARRRVTKELLRRYYVMAGGTGEQRESKEFSESFATV